LFEQFAIADPNLHSYFAMYGSTIETVELSDKIVYGTVLMAIQLSAYVPSQ